MSSDDSSNVAASLRLIAAEADEFTGTILKRCEKAAKKGLYNITFTIDYDAYHYIKNEEQNLVNKVLGPPFISRLRELGFTLSVSSKKSSWNSDTTIYELQVTW